MRAVAAQLQPEDEFAAAREQFAQMEAFLMSDEAHRKTHSELERELEQQGRELLRRFYQAHLELRAPGEAAAAVRDSEGQVRQQRRRQQRGLETVFGEVRVERLGFGGEGLQSLHPLDADLNLPPELYSHQVRRRAAEEAAEGSFDKVVEALSKTTGAQVGKRQVEEVGRNSMPSIRSDKRERWLRVRGRSWDLGGRQRSCCVVRICGRRRGSGPASEHNLQKRLSKGEKRHAKRMDGRGGVHPRASGAAAGGGDSWPRSRSEGKRPRHGCGRAWRSVPKRSSSKPSSPFPRGARVGWCWSTAIGVS